MTVNVSGDSETVKQRLQERSNQFQQEFDKLETPEEAFGLRLTALPVGEDVRFDDPRQLTALFPSSGDRFPWHSVKKNGQLIEFEFPHFSAFSSLQSYPWQLRSHDARRSDRDGLHKYPPSWMKCMFNYQELHCDGLLEFGHISCNYCGDIHFRETKGLILFDPDWPLVLLANLVIWADHIGHQASAHSARIAKYCIEIEIQRRGEKSAKIGQLGKGKTLFTQYPPELSDFKINYTLNLGETPAAPLPQATAETPVRSLSFKEKAATLVLTFYRDSWKKLRREGGGYGKKDDEIKFEVVEEQDK